MNEEQAEELINEIKRVGNLLEANLGVGELLINEVLKEFIPDEFVPYVPKEKKFMSGSKNLGGQKRSAILKRLKEIGVPMRRYT